MPKKDELDDILLEQFHSARRRLKTVQRLKRLLKNEPSLLELEVKILNKIVFFETMIKDKRLLVKKKHINKQSIVHTYHVFLYAIKFRNFFKTIIGQRKNKNEKHTNVT